MYRRYPLLSQVKNADLFNCRLKLYKAKSLPITNELQSFRQKK